MYKFYAMSTVWRSGYFVNLALKIQSILSEICSYRLLFRRFCPLGRANKYRLARKYTWKYTPIVSFFSPSAFDTKTLDSRIEESNVGHKLLMKMGKHWLNHLFIFSIKKKNQWIFYFLAGKQTGNPESIQIKTILISRWYVNTGYLKVQIFLFF